MAELIDIRSLEWEPVRPDFARGVHGKTLLDDSIKVTYTKVIPGGSVSPHQDKYGHLLYFLSGNGIVDIEGRRFNVYSGRAVSVASGDSHFYQNTGEDDLVLITMNIPKP